MSSPASITADRARVLEDLRDQVACAESIGGGALPFGIVELDDHLAAGGLHARGLHEIAAASPTLGDDAAATLFLAGIAARFAGEPRANVTWALTTFDLYAPGLEQVGLPANKVIYTQGKDDTMVLALAEDALRDGSFAAVIAEVKAADQTVTRRLQLAAADGATPMLLLRRWNRSTRDPLSGLSAAMTRWRIGSAPSTPLPAPGVGRGRWSVELVRQRGGNSFLSILEACDDTGRLALSAPIADRTAAAGGASSQAA
jgi:protein ImuA